MRERKEDSKMNTNGILREIKHLKREARRFSWLLSEELTHQVVRVLEEKEERSA